MEDRTFHIFESYDVTAVKTDKQYVVKFLYRPLLTFAGAKVSKS